MLVKCELSSMANDELPNTININKVMMLKRLNFLISLPSHYKVIFAYINYQNHRNMQGLSSLFYLPI